MPLPPDDGNPVRILLVEDHPALAYALCELLAQDDRLIVVDCVPNAAAARSHQHLDAVDVVLSDVHLPDDDGIALMEDLHAAHPGLSVVIMSGSGDETTGASALARGAEAYVEKGNAHENLIELLAGMPARVRT
jgi:DNA-binding NarL/FixJ family response regulator